LKRIIKEGSPIHLKPKSLSKIKFDLSNITVLTKVKLGDLSMVRSTAWTGLILLIILFIPLVSGEVSVQIAVFCGGSQVYDSGVSVGGANPTALDAIKASGISYSGIPSSYGYYLSSIAGCGGDWGPSFMINGEASPLGVSGYHISDGDQLIFLGPNSASSEAKYLFLTNVPSAVGKGEEFRVRVMEEDGYGFMPASPSAGAEVSFGNYTVTTDSNGFTPEIYLDQDAFYCIHATKSGCVASYYLGGLSWIQCGAGGPYICSVTGEGVINTKGNINYDETSSVSGVGFSSCRSHFENNFGSAFPARSSDIRQKGSGSYNAEKVVKQRPSGIDINESVDLKYEPTTSKAYSRPLNYASRYEDSISQRNYPKGAFFDEKYSNLDYLKRQSSYNNSWKINLSLESDFHGTAQLHARSIDPDASIAGLAGYKKDGILREEFLDTYIGSFKILRREVIPLVNETYYDYGNETNETEEYDALPCCSSGWTDLNAADDRRDHYAEGVFGCPSCSMKA
jgi:hypothetical protein